MLLHRQHLEHNTAALGKNTPRQHNVRAPASIDKASIHACCATANYMTRSVGLVFLCDRCCCFRPMSLICHWLPKQAKLLSCNIRTPHPPIRDHSALSPLADHSLHRGPCLSEYTKRNPLNKTSRLPAPAMLFGLHWASMSCHLRTSRQALAGLLCAKACSPLGRTHDI